MAALQEQSARYRLLFETINDAVFVHLIGDRGDPGPFIYVNDAACRILGYSRDELLAMTPRQITDAAHFEQAAAIREKLSVQGAMIFETVHLTRDGARIPVESHVRLFKHRGQTAALSIARDISARQKALDALRKNEVQLRLFIEHTPAAVAVCDLEMRYLAYSRRWITDYQLPDENLIGRCHYDVFQTISEKWKSEHRRCFAGEVIENREEPFQRADGSTDWVRRKVYPWRGSDGKISGLIMFTEVITDQRKLESSLQQARKLEAIGTLAGGVAHDFNNILMGIQGRVSLMLTDADRSEPDRHHLKAIESYIRNAADLTKAMLGFARGGKYEVKPVDLGTLVRRSAALFGRTHKEIEIRFDSTPDLRAANADEGQIEQVLINLYLNAAQAMPAGGRLYLSTANADLDEAYVQAHDVAAGPYAKISVTDTGCGMDRVTRQRIFDPFFTTRKMGRGTGLGLASAYGIIRNHHGIITVYSEPGQGTTFNIYLPASDRPVRSAAPLEDGALRTGTETLLLVDDEPMVVDVGRPMLERLGYTVLVARSGPEAVERFCAQRSKIDLVILDMVMPGMGGGETFDRLRAVDPGVKVLLSSGYSINGQATEILERGCNGFIQKPFNLLELSQTVRRLIDAGQPPAS